MGHGFFRILPGHPTVPRQSGERHTKEILLSVRKSVHVIYIYIHTHTHIYIYIYTYIYIYILNNKNVQIPTLWWNCSLLPSTRPLNPVTGKHLQLPYPMAVAAGHGVHRDEVRSYRKLIQEPQQLIPLPKGQKPKKWSPEDRAKWQPRSKNRHVVYRSLVRFIFFDFLLGVAAVWNHPSWGADCCKTM